MKLLSRHALAMMFVCIVSAITIMGGAARAQEYPTKPITLVVGFGVGGGADLYARSLASFANDSLGMPMVVVNRPGGSGMIGAKYVKDAPADGYTLLLQPAGTFYIKSSIDGDAAPATSSDFVSLGGIGSLTTALLVPDNSPFDSVRDLVEFAKANPDELRWAHSGRGGVHAMGGFAFLNENEIMVQDVPFNSGGQARAAISGEQVDFGFLGIQLLAGFEGKLRALAVTSDDRDAIYTDVPTMQELDLPQLGVSNPIVVYGPVDLSPDVIDRLRTAVEEIASSDGYQNMVKKTGASGFYMSNDSVSKTVEGISKAVDPVIETVFR